MKWFSFEGRASRKEWWIIVLITTLVSMVIGFVLSFLMVGVILATFTPGSAFGATALLGILITAAVTLVGLAAYYAMSVRRYHDRAKSGWWVLIAFIPVIGAIWQLVELGFLEGVDQNNPYGTVQASADGKPADKITVGDLSSHSVGSAA